jgi:hypothetical protein
VIVDHKATRVGQALFVQQQLLGARINADVKAFHLKDELERTSDGRA